METTLINRMQLEIRGMVQGVGFRPFVYNLAKKYALRGHVFNDTRGVHIEVEGESRAIDDFVGALQSNAPPLARIDSLEFHGNLDPVGYSDFIIRDSSSVVEKLALLSPDAATCSDCLRELFDPENRRYRYPFINCTNCGPRFTIIEDIPYDRGNTTMKVFRMCADCDREYHDPADRRFHAQPNACPACGPQVMLNTWTGNDAISEAIRRIQRGETGAIKGIGGYHLVCDALNSDAVSLLRARKYREDKPFALMAQDLSVIRDFCIVNNEEEKLLNSHRRPIVLLLKKPDCALPEAVAPGLNYLGFMLPYSPLHHLLLADQPGPLVMTSGNVSEEPIAYQDADAFRRLSGIADWFLTHNREIHVRCDDSVARIVQGNESIVRRSRGYVPDPISLPFEFRKQILACGAELKNTFCLTRGNEAFVSHHIGDLENLETLRSFKDGIEHFKKLFYLEPEVVAYDLHPEYLSTKYALDLASIPIKIAVQHHHAHIASCMADNRITGDVIGVAMDGLGLGLDGKLWGCEFLVANLLDFERFAHLRYMPLPGGTKAIREPWRMAATYLYHTYGREFLNLDLPFIQRLDLKTWKVLQKMPEQDLNSPLTSSMGRCFDAVSSLIGVRDLIRYEGQAAIELEMIADLDGHERYDFGWSEDGRTIEIHPVITGIVSDLSAKVPAGQISAKFHNAVVDLILQFAIRIRKQKKLERVALSGGVFQNMLLLDRTISGLAAEGFDVYTHHRVPTNDGGISLGQAVIANARLERMRDE